MPATFIFTKHAEKALLKLPPEIQSRILKKLTELKNHQNIITILKYLQNFAPATHRLRIGNYRLILKLDKQENLNSFEFTVLDVNHRKDVYK